MRRSNEHQGSAMVNVKRDAIDAYAQEHEIREWEKLIFICVFSLRKRCSSVVIKTRVCSSFSQFLLLVKRCIIKHVGKDGIRATLFYHQGCQIVVLHFNILYFLTIFSIFSSSFPLLSITVYRCEMKGIRQLGGFEAHKHLHSNENYNIPQTWIGKSPLRLKRI
jgi:hypothetical protein